MSANHDRLIAYGKYYQEVENIKKQHLKQTSLRFATSKILLGTFAVIGALYFTCTNFIDFNVMKITIFVPLLSIILILSIMLEDLITMERIRLSSFAMALSLEDSHDWLPKFHQNMFDKDEGEHHGSGHKKAKYYLGCVAILMILSAISFLLSKIAVSLLMMAIVISVYLVLYILIYIFIMKQVGKTSSMIKSVRDSHG